MSGALHFAPGGYAHVPGVAQYSGGVVALPGFRIRRVRFATVVPLDAGFRRAAEVIQAAGRPLAAFCACELRSPAPFTEAGFAAFNGTYQGTLADWGVMRDGVNPVARSNVCPEHAPPAAPGLHAFSFTVPESAAAPSFVVAGSGESQEGHATYRDHVVALGDTSVAGMRAKAGFVLGEMGRRMGVLGVGWADVTTAQVYTVHDIHPLLGVEVAAAGALRGELVWQFCRPPIVDLEFEMDCRGLEDETVLRP